MAFSVLYWAIPASVGIRAPFGIKAQLFRARGGWRIIWGFIVGDARLGMGMRMEMKRKLEFEINSSCAGNCDDG